MILKLRSAPGGCLYQLSDCRIKNGFYIFDFYCFPGQCHIFLLRTTNCSHHICQLEQQLFAAARHPPNWWALGEFPVSNVEQGWSASVHNALWGLRDPVAEPGGWNPETRDSENDRTGSWNPHRYCPLTTSMSFLVQPSRYMFENLTKTYRLQLPGVWDDQSSQIYSKSEEPTFVFFFSFYKFFIGV